MAFSMRMVLLRGSPLFHSVIKHSSNAVFPKQLFSKCAPITNINTSSFSIHCQKTLKQLLGSKLNAGYAFAFACTPISMYVALHSSNFKTFCEQLKLHIPASFTAQCAASCHPCGPHAALCQHGVLIMPPSCNERTRQTWMDSFIYMADDVVFKHLVLCVQFVKLCILFTPVMLLYPLTFYHCKFHQLWIFFMYKAVQYSGPVYIKLGQWAGSRRDLFSPMFCEKFSQLHAQVKPHSWNKTEKMLIDAYGRRWRETIKLDQDQQPVGSGCVAQVYKGYISHACIPPESDTICNCETLDEVYFREGLEIQSLADTFSFSSDSDDEPQIHIAYPPNCGCLYSNDPNYVAIAVKVLHPGIRERFAIDLNLINKLAMFMEFCMPSLRWVNLKQCCKEFSITMARQMDLIHEARALRRLSSDFCDNDFVKIPVPIMSLVCRNILIESFEVGNPISDFIQEQPGRCDYAGQCLRNKMSEIVVNALLQMVFIKNFVHSDLHPGNILVQNSTAVHNQLKASICGPHCGSKCPCETGCCQLRLVLLDAGITASLNCEDRHIFKQLVTAIVKGQGYVVADLFLNQSICQECPEPCEFRHSMACLVERLHGANNRVCKARVSDVLGDFFRVLTAHKVRLDSNFSKMLLAIAILEGLGRSLNPELDILGKTCDVILPCKC